MALELDFSICSHKPCEEIAFTDQTKAYVDPSNLTGYDIGGVVANHPGISNAATVTFAFTTPGATTYTFDLLVEGYPTVDSTLEFLIAGTDLGYADNKILDGVYTGLYTVIYDAGEIGTYTKTKQVFLTCMAECCIEKMYALVTDTCTDCESGKILTKAIEADGYLHAAKSAFNCGKVNLAKRLLAKVQYLCTNYNCNCC